MSDAAHRRLGRLRNRLGAWPLLPIVGVALALRFVNLGDLALIGDESYYWLWSRNLDWAYYDHPAGVALLVRASTALAGSGHWGIRWLNALLGGGCVLLTFRVGQWLSSRRAGLWAAAAVAVGAPYVITSRFVYTDVLLLFLMLVNLLLFWRLAQEDAGLGAALAFGASLALLFNTKYSAYLYAAALLVAVLIDHRRRLHSRYLWIGGLVGALGLLPVLLWNGLHHWVSFRWQLLHATTAINDSASLLGNAHHACVYLSPPLLVLGVLGLGRFRTASERLLTLVALFLLLPVALSRASSPRNLTTGLVPLLILACSRLPPNLKPWSHRLLAGLLALSLLGSATYGIGTVVDLAAPSALPSSSIVPVILRDAAGWPALGAALSQGVEPVFALDYSMAAQIRYYARRPATTAWGQYRIWGIPDFEDATILALDYLPADWMTRRLGGAFETVAGPECLIFTERGATKVVNVWHAKGLHLDQQQFLRRFDFLTLLGEAP
jgi:4-amino-4-deoxy-L-arabinose transferase-like glycosyltransferase